MGNAHYPIPPLRQCTYALQNRYSLTPAETTLMNYIFSQYTNKQRRMDLRQFKKVYKRINYCVVLEDLEYASKIAFCAADTNCDGWLSFDEFLDAYVNYKVTPNFYRAPNTGLFLY